MGKLKSRSQLVKDLDSIYSKYIRLLKSDEYGYCLCVTSGKRMFWTEAQNGHFYSRKYYPTRWDDDNCHPQSMTDNIFLRGNYIEYTKYMIDKYGRDFVDQLGFKARNGKKISTQEIREKTLFYKTEVERLKSEKSL